MPHLHGPHEGYGLWTLRVGEHHLTFVALQYGRLLRSTVTSEYTMIGMHRNLSLTMVFPMQARLL